MHFSARHVLPLALALAASSAQAAPKIADSLPGPFHVSALADVEGLVRDLPELATEGIVADQMDALVARGFPDPRDSMTSLGIGALLGKPDGLKEGMAMGVTDEPLLPKIRALAEQEGVELKESAYRGVPFLTGSFEKDLQRESEPARFGDVGEGLITVGYDQGGAYAATHAGVDSVAGRIPTYREQYKEGLSANTYLVGRMVLSKAVRNDLAGTKLKSLAHLVGGSVKMEKRGGKVALKLRAQATGSIKARFALSMLSRKLKEIANESSEPAVKRLLLQQTKLNRSGAEIQIDMLSPRNDFVVGLVALQDLIPASK